MPTEHQPAPIASAETGYYGRPLLKPPVWSWEVPLYLFAGGLGGAAAVIAAVSDWKGESRTLVRDARWLAAISGPVSAALLIADLGRPERFVNMLRVFKRQSPMSVGSWTLAAFSTVSGMTALASAFDGGNRRRRRLKTAARMSGTASAAFGTVLATYTGVLIGATAIPAWNRNAAVLPVHFAASGIGAATSLLELLGHRDRALHRLAFGAAAVETLIGASIEADRSVAQLPLRTGSSGAIRRAGGLLSGPAAMIGRGSRSTRLHRIAAVCGVAGSLVTRLAWIAAGRRSAHDPTPALNLPAASGIAHTSGAEEPVGAASR